ncbi:M16 family metallopeptidase [Lysobacter soyae]|uniref:Insulinase family protein n=1 Tax=Lysobacter soyae TaxID=2764185 RepID=A0ABX8WN03_9GAMM|nr:pitrilysin family protein [Lysobacter sp. CJ11]QYR52995.1 insulinase family protein [Lysobacter sp. CJ11]
MNLKLRPASLAIALGAALVSMNPALAAQPAKAQSGAGQLAIPATQFTLPNGLKVIVHEDRKAPVVALHVWYRVGSKDEPAGKTGFAHLFEHLMFNGSENHPGEYFGPFEKAGVSNINGTTWLDRTNYFQVVPTTALDMALWMESDRMGHLLGAIDQKTLDEQRGVVQNEKRQGQNQPYGRVDEVMLPETFPANHPYHHDTIGSMDDLNAASLEDVKNWFRDYYGAANTVLVLTGDIDAKTAKEKVMKYFGDIAPGQPVARQAEWTAPRAKSSRNQMEDRVAQTRIYREWNVPARSERDYVLLDIAGDVLGGGKTSRLYQRLVFQDKLADSVSVGITPFQLASQFQLTADVKKGVDPAKVEAVIAEEWAKFLKDGPTQDELDRIKVANRASMTRSLERINTKANLLAESELYLGDANNWKRTFNWNQSATAADVLKASQKWISKGDYTITVVPANGTPKEPTITPLPAGKRPADIAGAPTDKFKATPSSLDRKLGVPAVTSFPDISFPNVQRGKLDNGIEVILAERHSVPVVAMNVLFDSGAASDAGSKLGLASFATGMLDEGTAKRSATQIAQDRERLGLNLGTGCSLDTCTVTVNALKSNLKPSLELVSDVVRHAAFNSADIERLRGQWLAQIEQEKTEPDQIAARLLAPLVYGEGHPYAVPGTGSGTTASVKSITRDDIQNWTSKWIRPDNATIIVAGDTTMAEITRELNAAFGDWKPADVARGTKNFNMPKRQTKPRVFLVDKPGAQQSVVIAGDIAPPTGVKNNLDINTMNGAFGGAFTSRLNMNLREDKHWSYGARSSIGNAQHERLFRMVAPVQTDKTAESLAEMVKEVNWIRNDKPLTQAEQDKINNNAIRAMPGQYETIDAVMSTLVGNQLYDRPDNYVQTLKGELEAQKLESINAAAKEIIHPDSLTWVVVGDLSKIEAGVRALNLGEVTVIDADGNPVAKK